MNYNQKILKFLEESDILRELFKKNRYDSEDSEIAIANMDISKVHNWLKNYKISNSDSYHKTFNGLKSKFEEKLLENKTSFNSELKKIEKKYGEIKDATDFIAMGVYWHTESIEYSLLDFFTNEINIPVNNAGKPIANVKINDLNIFFNKKDDDVIKRIKEDNRNTLIERLKEQKKYFHRASEGYAIGAFIKYLSGKTINRDIDNWKELIKKELHPRLEAIESKIVNKVSNWKEGKDLIECAAFCQLLFDMKYFVKGSTKRKSVNSFAMRKYGIDIENQLNSSKRKYRENHKNFFNKYFR